MASQQLSRLLPNISKTCLKRAFNSQNSKKYQKPFLVQFVENEEYEHRAIVPFSHVPEVDMYHEFYHADVQKPIEPKLDHKSAFDLLECRLQLLQKQLQCSEEEVHDLFKKLPRLHDLNLLDEFIRNIEVLLSLYEPRMVSGFVQHHPCHIAQTDETRLRRLASGRRQNIRKLMSALDHLVKGDDVSEAEFFASLLGLQPSEELPLVFTSNMSYSNIKETVDYLLYEGVPKSFLQQFSPILMYSMKRLDHEIQYIKREFGELDTELLRGRIMEANSKGFRKSLVTAAELLKCRSSAFTSLQKKHIVSIYTTDVENSINYLFSIGFSPQDIRNCVYIIGQKRELIAAARNEVLATYSIDESDKRTLINAILYQIKTWVGFGS